LYDVNGGTVVILY